MYGLRGSDILTAAWRGGIVRCAIFKNLSLRGNQLVTNEYPYNTTPQGPQGSNPGYGAPGASQGNYPTNPSNPQGYPGASYPQAQQAGFVAQPAVPVMPVTPVIHVATPSAPGSGLAVAGMVCGIVGVVFAVIPVCGMFVAVPLGLCATIMGALGRKSHTHRGQGTAGLVLGIITLVLSLGLYFLVYTAAHQVRVN